MLICEIIFSKHECVLYTVNFSVSFLLLPQTPQARRCEGLCGEVHAGPGAAQGEAEASGMPRTVGSPDKTNRTVLLHWPEW